MIGTRDKTFHCNTIDPARIRGRERTESPPSRGPASFPSRCRDLQRGRIPCARLPASGARALPRDVATPRWPHLSRRGFTLIELLVVLVIVGVLAAALVLAVGASSERQLDQAAQRFQALVEHACTQAELTGREIGVNVAADGYAFSQLDGDRWRAFGNDGELRGRAWPRGLRFDLTRDGRALVEVPDGTPQLVCFSSGELTPFALALTLGDAPRYRISGGGFGRLQMERIGASP